MHLDGPILINTEKMHKIDTKRYLHGEINISEYIVIIFTLIIILFILIIMTYFASAKKNDINEIKKKINILIESSEKTNLNIDDLYEELKNTKKNPSDNTILSDG